MYKMTYWLWSAQPQLHGAYEASMDNMQLGMKLRDRVFICYTRNSRFDPSTE